jgi:hypothetical protein
LQCLSAAGAALILAIGPVLTLSARQSAVLLGLAVALLIIGAVGFVAYLRALGRLDAAVGVLVAAPAE